MPKFPFRVVTSLWTNTVSPGQSETKQDNNPTPAQSHLESPFEGLALAHILIYRVWTESSISFPVATLECLNEQAAAQ